MNPCDADRLNTGTFLRREFPRATTGRTAHSRSLGPLATLGSLRPARELPGPRSVLGWPERKTGLLPRGHTGAPRLGVG